MPLDRSAVQTVPANGLTFAYYEMGAGPLVLCLHGFPDSAETWADLLPRLADGGYRAVAPFMRGYPPTDIPTDGDYFPDRLAADVLALMTALGADTASVIGHDWGASAVYGATTQAPARVRKLVTAAVPHPASLRPSPRLLWGTRHFFAFQRRARTLRTIRADPRAFLRDIYARWSPNWTPDDRDLDPVLACWAEPGAIEAALGYYWSFLATGFGARGRALNRLLRARIDVPTLTFVGDADGAIPAAAFGRAAACFGGPYRLVTVPRAGHFLHREDPRLFADEVLAFLSA